MLLDLFGDFILIYGVTVIYADNFFLFLIKIFYFSIFWVVFLDQDPMKKQISPILWGLAPKVEYFTLRWVSSKPDVI